VYNSVVSMGAHGADALRRNIPDSAGAFLLATEKHVQVNQYRDFDYPTKENNQATRRDEEYKEEFRADNFADAIAQAETLCVNAHGVAKYLLSRAVRDAGYKVVIMGEGSDEILGGYPHFRRDMLLYNREGQDEAAIAELLQWLDQQNTVSRGLLLPDGEIGSMEQVKRILGYAPSCIGPRCDGLDQDRCPEGPACRLYVRRLGSHREVRHLSRAGFSSARRRVAGGVSQTNRRAGNARDQIFLRPVSHRVESRQC